VAQATSVGPRDLGLSYCSSDPLDVPNLGSVETVFVLGQSTLLYQILAAYPDNDAAQIIERLRRTVEACPVWTETAPDGSQVTFRMAAVPFPSIGDEAVAFHILVEGENQAERGELSLLRRGTVLSLIIRLDVDAGNASEDPLLMERIATRADRKMVQVVP
jgi:hypothetical protein